MTKRIIKTNNFLVEFVSATRAKESVFWKSSPLGCSLRRLMRMPARFSHTIFALNTRPLPECYNERISDSQADCLVFVHDDVWLDDFHILTRLEEALSHYDIAGVAGNKRRTEYQPAWAYVDQDLNWDSGCNLSGAVAAGEGPFGTVTWFGPPAECKLLDGVFLAVNRRKLVACNALFDPQFAFHLYDTDFCRTVESKGLKLGTWPLAITHQSGGAYGSPSWHLAKDAYFRKWCT
jgi:GT2 family glycosyltransferase